MSWLGKLLGPRRSSRPQRTFRRRSLRELASVGLRSGVSHVKASAKGVYRSGRTRVRAAERRRYGHPLTGRERLQAGYHRAKNAYEDWQSPRSHGQISFARTRKRTNYKLRNSRAPRYTRRASYRRPARRARYDSPF